MQCAQILKANDSNQELGDSKANVNS